MQAQIKTTIHNRFDIFKTNIQTGETKKVGVAENIVLAQMWSRLTGRSAYFVNIHYGTGTGALSAARTSLFTHLGTKAAVDVTLIKALPVASWKRKIVLNPEDNIGAVLTEVGISYDATSTHLVTHALIKDSEGKQISITKTAVDIITIYATVYITFSFSATELSLCSLPNNNPLMNYLVGGASIGNCYFYTGECDYPAGAFNDGLISSAIGTSAAITWTADVPNKKMTTSTTRFAVDQSNGHLKEVTFGTNLLTAILRLALPSSIYAGLPLTSVPLGTGDGATALYALPSRNIDESTFHVYLDAVETTAFTFGKGSRPLVARADSPYRVGNGLKKGVQFARVAHALACADQWVSPYYRVLDWNNGGYIARAAGPDVAGVSQDTALSDDGLILAVAHEVSPYITTFDWVAGAWVKRPDPAVLPTGIGYGCSLSGNGLVLAVAHTASPYITTYDWTAGAWVKRTNPATLPVGNGRGCSLTNDGLVMAIGHESSPFVSVYDWTAGAWVKRANPATLPITAVGYTSLSRSDGGLTLALMQSTSSYGTGGPNPIMVYDWVAGAWIKRATPTNNYVHSYGMGYGCSISTDEKTVVGVYGDSSALYSMAFYEIDLYDKTLIFNTPPANGAVITADYTVSGLHKTAQRVIDLTAIFTFGAP